MHLQQLPQTVIHSVGKAGNETELKTQLRWRIHYDS